MSRIFTLTQIESKFKFLLAERVLYENSLPQVSASSLTHILNIKKIVINFDAKIFITIIKVLRALKYCKKKKIPAMMRKLKFHATIFNTQ